MSKFVAGIPIAYGHLSHDTEVCGTTQPTACFFTRWYDGYNSTFIVVPGATLSWFTLYSFVRRHLDDDLPWLIATNPGVVP